PGSDVDLRDLGEMVANEECVVRRDRSAEIFDRRLVVGRPIAKLDQRFLPGSASSIALLRTPSGRAAGRSIGAAAACGNLRVKLKPVSASPAPAVLMRCRRVNMASSSLVFFLLAVPHHSNSDGPRINAANWRRPSYLARRSLRPCEPCQGPSSADER